MEMNYVRNNVIQDYAISPEQMNWFMNIYNIPNLIAPIIGGSLVDKGVGKRYSGLTCIYKRLSWF